MSAPQPQVNAGAILAGRWQIQDFIGNGETGEVYGVRDMHGASTFALKLFWPNALGQAEIWSAFQQTARTASGLGVEGVARAYDFGIDANSGRPFFVTERVSWSSLADRVRLRGPLTPAEMSTALGVLARALDGAHAAGVVHRDLKPENVFVSPDNANWVRISDFGVALLRSAAPPPPGWGGTIGWVAPDAADPNSRSTPAMDIFSLGLVTFFALSGGALHRAARSTPVDANALWQELSAPLDSASLRARELGASLDPAFDAWFQRAVAPLAQHRFGSVSEMASAFDAVVRTLVAPQSQNAVALQGVAVAIAQPLIFQPDAPKSAPAYAAPVAAAYAPIPEETLASASAPPAKKSAALLIGGAAFLFAVTGLGFGALYHHRREAAEEATAAALASASASAAAAQSAANAATTAAATAAAPAPAEPTAVVAAVEPPASATAEPAAPKPAPAANSAATAKAALVAPKPVTTAVAAATAKPAASAAAKPAKPAVTAAASAKPAVSAKPAATAAASATLKPVTKPSMLTPPKKKCGSTFIPCK